MKSLHCRCGRELSVTSAAGSSIIVCPACGHSNLLVPDQVAEQDVANTVIEETKNVLRIRTSAGVAYSTLAVLTAWVGMSIGITVMFWVGAILPFGKFGVMVPLLAWVGYLIYVRTTNRITITVNRREISISHTAWVYPSRETRLLLDDCRQAFVSRRRTMRRPSGRLLQWYVILKHGFFIDQYYVYLARENGWRHALCAFSTPDAGQRVADRINHFLNWKTTPVVSTWYQRFPLLEATNDERENIGHVSTAITASSFPLPAWTVGCLTMLILNSSAIALIIWLGATWGSIQKRQNQVAAHNATAQSAASAERTGRVHPLLDHAAPPITLSRLDGTPFPWTNHVGREIVVVGFFNDTDQINRRMLGEFAVLSTGNVGPKTATCTVYAGESPENAQPIWQRLRFPLEFLVDADGTLSQQYQIDHMPCVFIVDSSGIIRWYEWGDKEDLTPDLRQQLIRMRSTKAPAASK